MRARVQKWGNSLALRIPKALAAEAGLNQDAAVEMSLVRRKIVIRPIAEEPETLDDLLKRITKRNRHGLVDFGPPVGREVW